MIRFLFWKRNRRAKSNMLSTVTLLLRWRPTKIRLTSFNVIIGSLVLDEPHPGIPKTARTKHNGRPPIESARDSRYLKSPCGSYPSWNIGHEKTVGAIGNVFAHSEQLRDHFRAVFDPVQAQFEGVSVLFRDRWQGIDPLVCTRGQITVETVNFTRQMCSNEAKDCVIGQNGDGYLFWDSPGVGLGSLHRKTLTAVYYLELLGWYYAELHEEITQFGEEWGGYCRHEGMGASLAVSK